MKLEFWQKIKGFYYDQEDKRRRKKKGRKQQEDNAAVNFAAAWKESEVAKAVMEAAKKAATAKVRYNKKLWFFSGKLSYWGSYSWFHLEKFLSLKISHFWRSI